MKIIEKQSFPMILFKFDIKNIVFVQSHYHKLSHNLIIFDHFESLLAPVSF